MPVRRCWRELNEIGARRGIRRLSATAWLERAYAALRGSDPDGARRSLALGGDASIWQGFGNFHLHASEIEDPLIAELRVQLVLGQGDQALPQLEAALQAAEAVGRRRRALRLLFLQAQVFESLGRRREASVAFHTAVTKAAGCGLVRTLADDNWATESLIKRAAVASDPRAAALLRELTSPPNTAVFETKQISPGDTSGVAFHLTNREVQILRLLWKGHSNKAIARDLFLTENTIETHLRRIYEKLGTRNRTQAAALAREAGAI